MSADDQGGLVQLAAVVLLFGLSLAGIFAARVGTLSAPTILLPAKPQPATRGAATSDDSALGMAATTAIWALTGVAGFVTGVVGVGRSKTRPPAATNAFGVVFNREVLGAAGAYFASAAHVARGLEAAEKDAAGTRARGCVAGDDWDHVADTCETRRKRLLSCGGRPRRSTIERALQEGVTR